VTPSPLSPVQAQKHIALRNRTVRNRVWLAGVLAGIAGGVAWLILAPDHGTKPQDRLALGLVGGLAAAALAQITARQWLFPTLARCPTCGHDWEIQEGRSAQPRQQMTHWRQCPGCGIRMDDTSS
jgi:predicted RNA-binding Zn-ribbon protein involved in translation (DUF1610 family)